MTGGIRFKKTRKLKASKEKLAKVQFIQALIIKCSLTKYYKRENVVKQVEGHPFNNRQDNVSPYSIIAIVCTVCTW